MYGYNLAVSIFMLWFSMIMLPFHLKQSCFLLCRFARVGSVVLTLHEGSDVFLEIGLMSKYCGYERIASFSFAMFVLSWLILRLIYFPFWIIWSTRCVHLRVQSYLLTDFFHIYHPCFVCATNLKNKRG